MTTNRYLVTGALGCIGAWAVKHLLEAQQPVWTYDLGGSKHRLELILDDTAIANVNFISGDITDYSALERAVADNGITHIIHLAALQIPLVRANPTLGAQVNVVGMANVLEIARQHKDQIKGLSYASSFAVYGPPGAATFETSSLYGIHKQAKEGMARIYWQDYGVGSLSLRPHTVYGPGRDQGMTSLPTKAMLAAAVGRAYRIGYGGMALYHHASDVAKAFILAANTPYQGAAAFDLPGILAPMQEVVTAIETAVPDMAGKITFDSKPLPVRYEPDASQFYAILGDMQWTSLVDGAQQTIKSFQDAIRKGRIDVEKSLS